LVTNMHRTRYMISFDHSNNEWYADSPEELKAAYDKLKTQVMTGLIGAYRIEEELDEFGKVLDRKDEQITLQ
jgi:hypothetical protein